MSALKAFALGRTGGVVSALALGQETGGRAQLVSLLVFWREPEA